MKKIILLLSTALIISFNTIAQEGKPSMKIFSNFNYDMSADEDENAFKEFELKRAYLGYSYKIDENFSTKITFDVGNNESGSAYTAFLKIASLKWNASNNLSINVGMLGSKTLNSWKKHGAEDILKNQLKINTNGLILQILVLQRIIKYLIILA